MMTFAPSLDRQTSTSRLASARPRRAVIARALSVVTLLALAIFPMLPGDHAASPLKAAAATKTLTIGAKGFPENEIVAYMYVLLLQHAGIPVNSSIKDNLASQVATPALQRGDIDIFPEYTGTGLEAILQQTAPHTSSPTIKRSPQATCKKYQPHLVKALSA